MMLSGSLQTAAQEFGFEPDSGAGPVGGAGMGSHCPAGQLQTLFPVLPRSAHVKKRLQLVWAEMAGLTEHREQARDG